MTLGRRVAILRGGAIEQVGSPLDLYRDPANRFVAGFLGSPALNLWPGALADRDEVEAAGARVRVGPAVRARLSDAVRFEVGVRPEDVQLALEPRHGWACGEVLVVEPLGRDTIVTLESAGVRVVVRAGGETAFEAGARVWFAVDPCRVFFFDAGSGRRIGGDTGPGTPAAPGERG